MVERNLKISFTSTQKMFSVTTEPGRSIAQCASLSLCVISTAYYKTARILQMHRVFAFGPESLDLCNFCFHQALRLSLTQLGHGAASRQVRHFCASNTHEMRASNQRDLRTRLTKETRGSAHFLSCQPTSQWYPRP